MSASRSQRRRVLVVAIAVAAVLALLCVGFVPAMVTSVFEASRSSAAFGFNACGSAGLALPGRTQITGFDSGQVNNARVIVGVGQQMRVPPKGWIVAVATAMRESTLHNRANPTVPESLKLPHEGVGTDHDSLGLFQQRPSQGWGTPAQLLDTRYASAKFYEKLLRVPGWEQMRLTEAADAVQRSGFPDKYQQWAPAATLMVNRLTNGAANGVAGSDGGVVQCAGPGEVSAAGWTVPTPGVLGSGFRTADRPAHDGVDIMAPRGTAIRAAAAGIVITVLCNVSSGTCDQDGSPAVAGCGWYVEVAHGGGLLTRYCHMVHQPAVVVGQRVAATQLLGHVGSSGNSSGPHLHYETRINGAAVDPELFMAQRGAPLTRRT